MGKSILRCGSWGRTFCTGKKNSPKIAENHYFEVLNNFSKKKNFLIRIFWIFLRSPLTEKKLWNFSSKIDQKDEQLILSKLRRKNFFRPEFTKFFFGPPLAMKKNFLLEFFFSKIAKKNDKILQQFWAIFFLQSSAKGSALIFPLLPGIVFLVKCPTNCSRSSNFPFPPRTSPNETKKKQKFLAIQTNSFPAIQANYMHQKHKDHRQYFI